MERLFLATSVIICILFSANLPAQDGKPTQTIRSSVTDAASGQPLPFVNAADFLPFRQIGTTGE
jgi:hypothetical protein